MRTRRHRTAVGRKSHLVLMNPEEGLDCVTMGSGMQAMASAVLGRLSLCSGHAWSTVTIAIRTLGVTLVQMQERDS